MSLLVEAAEAGLAHKIRNRIAAGANVRETTGDEVPAWLASELGETEVHAVFQSEHAAVAILGNGRTVVRKVR